MGISVSRCKLSFHWSAVGRAAHVFWRRGDDPNMASTLSSEFGKFSKLTKQLRQILRDTQRCFHDINSCGGLSNGE